MRDKLFHAAKELVEKYEEAYPELKGKRASQDDIDELEKAINRELPEWYKELITTYPIIGIEMGFEDYEPNEENYHISRLEFLDIRGIIFESTQLIPGASIIDKGFLCIASCVLGSGDPYFISLNTSEDPVVYRVYHDLGEDGDEIIENGMDAVSPSLSTLFKNAKI